MQEEIIYDDNNFRSRGQESKELIAKSLEKNGAGRSILLDSSGKIVAGNGVYEEAKRLGIPVQIVETDGQVLIAVKRKDLSPDEERRRNLALADNAIPLLAEWNQDALKAHFDYDAASEWGVFLESDLDPSDMGDFFKTQPQEPTPEVHRLTFDFSREDYDRIVEAINSQELSKEDFLLKLINDADLS